MLQGTLFIFDIHVKVLLDTGASHSFISVNLVDKLNLKLILLDNSVCVPHPIGGQANLDIMCLKVHISFQG